MLFSLTLVVGSLVTVYAAPQIQIGSTNVVGRDVTLLRQDFFGGARFN